MYGPRTYSPPKLTRGQTSTLASTVGPDTIRPLNPPKNLTFWNSWLHSVLKRPANKRVSTSHRSFGDKGIQAARESYSISPSSIAAFFAPFVGKCFYTFVCRVPYIFVLHAILFKRPLLCAIHNECTPKLRMDYPLRSTVCISSQIGCAKNCQFCMTGKMGFVRNLTAGEILGQVFFARQTVRLHGMVRSATTFDR